MALTIEIIRGTEAHQCRNDDEFIRRWDSLAKQTAHVSVFQEPAFVNSWHDAYKQYFEPIFVLGTDISGNLVGLIPLTIDKETNKLMHAGGWHAEYHGWLAEPTHEQIFMPQAMAAIKQQFPLSTWQWTFLPPRCNTDWLKSRMLVTNGIYANIELTESPLLDLHDEEKLTKILKSKSIKSKINRLKRLGELRIERIVSKERVEQLIDQIAVLVNFRHEAVHQVAPFETDFLQKEFYLERSNNLEENHFSILWMGDKLLAFHYGAIDQDTIYIGLTAFDPTVSKHSPGVIFLIYLAQLLQQEGIRYIDLTPGGDEYKERFSNQHQIISKPNFYFNKIEKLKNESKAISSKIITKSIGHLKKEKQQDSPSNKQEYHRYAINIAKYEENKIKETNTANVQNFSDLLLYDNEKQALKRPAILSHAMQRFCQADTLFSVTKNNQLIAHAWASKIGSTYKRLAENYNPGKTGVVLDYLDQDFQLLEKDKIKSLLPTMLEYVFKNGATDAFIYLPKNSSSSLFEEIGFTRNNLC